MLTSSQENFFLLYWNHQSHLRHNFFLSTQLQRCPRFRNICHYGSHTTFRFYLINNSFWCYYSIIDNIKNNCKIFHKDLIKRIFSIHGTLWCIFQNSQKFVCWYSDISLKKQIYPWKRNQTQNECHHSFPIARQERG